jgi:sec-independent protein translocase protein TatA
MLENLGKPEHLLLVLVIVLLLFGAKRLPDLAKGIGKSVRILRDEVKDRDDDRPADSGDDAPPAAKTTPPVAEPAPPSNPVPPSQPTDDTEHKQV